MNLNNDVVYRPLRLGPLHQLHPGRSRSLIRHHNRLHRSPLCVEFLPVESRSGSQNPSHEQLHVLMKLSSFFARHLEIERVDAPMTSTPLVVNSASCVRLPIVVTCSRMPNDSLTDGGLPPQRSYFQQLP